MKNQVFTSDRFDTTEFVVSARGPGGGQGNPGNPGAGNGNGSGSGGGSTKKGELYGDQIVVLRDLDPIDGDGNGQPVLDPYDQLIAVGYDPEGLVRPDDDDHLFPIYFEEIAEGDYEIPADMLDYVQEVELERANVARAPVRVTDKALATAVEKLLAAVTAGEAAGEDDYVMTDPAGRLMYSTDGVTYLTIDAPLENLAVYQALLTAGTSGTWTGVQEDWDEIDTIDGVKNLSFLANVEGFDVSSLLAAAWAKEGEITLDALIYENTTLGVNDVTMGEGGVTIDYFDFTEVTDDGVTESYDYVRSDRYEDTWLRWIEIVVDPDTSEEKPVFVYGTVFDAVFGGVEWDADDDLYLAVDTKGTEDRTDDDFVDVDASDSGLNDFAQAADDARAVIEFIHANQAVEVLESEVPVEALVLEEFLVVDEFLFV